MNDSNTRRSSDDFDPETLKLWQLRHDVELSIDLLERANETAEDCKAVLQQLRSTLPDRFMPDRAQLQAAWEAIRQLPDARRVWGGWEPRDVLEPSDPRRRIADGEARFLVVQSGPKGVDVEIDQAEDRTSAPVVVMIREGTALLDAVEHARAAVGELEQRVRAAVSPAAVAGATHCQS
jgi:hypothetical protein